MCVNLVLATDSSHRIARVSSSTSSHGWTAVLNGSCLSFHGALHVFRDCGEIDTFGRRITANNGDCDVAILTLAGEGRTCDVLLIAVVYHWTAEIGGGVAHVARGLARVVFFGAESIGDFLSASGHFDESERVDYGGRNGGDEEKGEKEGVHCRYCDTARIGLLKTFEW
ncbi:hypothetical protein PFISCL1PPCAC_10660 [Pristionchus fissidentatus]|uniref:Uncharacterized protein n=1 Tax=Pristionchus fissidentatus TaxID=1538716 RepID=A0AAV5VM24_9BILA|nr:hypothetical protein PFISCL1PPCAC_10660 [Pristionchus fissidentatus]